MRQPRSHSHKRIQRLQSQVSLIMRQLETQNLNPLPCTVFSDRAILKGEIFEKQKGLSLHLNPSNFEY